MNVSITLYTPIPAFANDLCDILKLFFTVDGFTVVAAESPKETESTPSQGEALYHALWEQDNQWHCRFAFRGQPFIRTADIPAEIEPSRRPLIFKRLQKRLCKLTLYDLLKKTTGEQPPWGSLTGVRPTRLLYENIDIGMTLPESASALCRDFDVSASKAELLRRIVAEQMRLPPPSPQEVDVYLSIPFCRTRCAYCSFPGETVSSHTEDYLAALLAELQETAKLMTSAGLSLRALYIGGGTPTALSEGAFARLIERTADIFPNAQEWTVEAGRPDTITRQKLQTLLDFGISRISINPQTMNDKTLIHIGREHTAAQTAESFALARSMGFDNINMDVIAGLPGETAADFAFTMNAIRDMNPESLTVHTLAIKRSSRLDLEQASLPDGDVTAQMVQMGKKTAAALQMQPYYLYRQKYMAGQQENVGYAKPGQACLYNVDIMEENTSILACGAGAISKRVFTDRELRIERAPNVSNVAVYVSRIADMMERKKELFR